jgi:ribA/ribD-fused uncharacterized protein
MTGQAPRQHAPILTFTGKYAFLSNFSDSQITVSVDGMGEVYPTVEHAFQAAKSTDPMTRRRIRNANGARQAKVIGGHIELRPDWENIKLGIMKTLLLKKFHSTPLKSWLLETGDALLVEGNWWHDTYWGVCEGKGENHLGLLLMEVRDELAG